MLYDGSWSRLTSQHLEAPSWRLYNISRSRTLSLWRVSQAFGVTLVTSVPEQVNCSWVDAAIILNAPKTLCGSSDEHRYWTFLLLLLCFDRCTPPDIPTPPAPHPIAGNHKTSLLSNCELSGPDPVSCVLNVYSDVVRRQASEACEIVRKLEIQITIGDYT